MSRWFRHYAGMMRDEKLVRAALKSKQSVERVLWVWGAVLESAAEIDDNGKFDVDGEEIAYFLRSDAADIRAIFSALTDAGRVVENRVVNWGDRQFTSDRSATRQAAYRERKRQQGDGDDHKSDGGVTSRKRDSDAPKTDTETETDTELPLPSGNGRAAVDLCKGVFDSGVALLTGDGEPERSARSFLGRLRKQHGDPAVIDALARCEVTRPSDPKAWLTANCRGTTNATSRPQRLSTRQIGERFAARLASGSGGNPDLVPRLSAPGGYDRG